MDTAHDTAYDTAHDTAQYTLFTAADFSGKEQMT
jgi:hypothetical protein